MGDNKRGWPLRIISAFEEPHSEIATPITILGVVVFVALVVIGFLTLAWLLADLVSGDQNRAAGAARAALPILAAAIGLPLVIWRLLILDQQTKISEEKTQIDRETHYTSIFSRSIDQLGQTRELKTTSEEDAGLTQVTKTVPNIEVRLGGIHSLTRLAEESPRDREKIDKILRSYIRENSWSDRFGQIAERLPWSTNPIYAWAYDYNYDRTNEDTIDLKNKWIKAADEQIRRSGHWAARLPETRVDVNEAADALETYPNNIDSKTKPTLYECLFVGRHFNSHFLAKIQFMRCTFVRCTFDYKEANELAISDSQLIRCKVKYGSCQIRLSRCRLSEVYFEETNPSQLNTQSCDHFSVQLSSTSEFRAINGTFFRSSINVQLEEPRKLTTLDLRHSVVIQSQIDGLKLSSQSNLEDTTNIDTKLNNVDLSDVSSFYERTLASYEASPHTQHPSCTDRPASWPAFDPNFDDDDIPF